MQSCTAAGKIEDQAERVGRHARLDVHEAGGDDARDADARSLGDKYSGGELRRAGQKFGRIRYGDVPEDARGLVGIPGFQQESVRYKLRIDHALPPSKCGAARSTQR